MKFSFLIRLGWLVLAAGGGLTGFAQQPASEPPAPPAPSAPATPPADDDRAKLRRLDDTAAPAEPAVAPAPRRRARSAQGDVPLGNHEVTAGTRRREIVSIMGSSVVAGEVASDAVSILGRTEITRGAKVGGGAVAVLGRLDSQGEIAGDSVSVLGASSIDGRVGGDAVAVLGNMHLGPNAVIKGDLVVIGGRLNKDPAAVVHGEQVHIPFAPAPESVEWLATWVRECLLWGRPLGFGANLGWAWVVAGVILGFHLFVALLFPRGIAAAAATLENRPGGSVLAAILTVVLSPVVFVLLAITLVGALVVPLLGLGLFVAALVGKTVMLAWLGRRITGVVGAGSYGPPVLAVLIGGVIVAGLYTIPVVGFLTFKLLSWLGLGVVVYTVALSLRRERPAPAAAGPAGAATIPPPAPPPFSPPPAPPREPMVSEGSGAAPAAFVAAPLPPSTTMGFSAAAPVESPVGPPPSVPPPPLRPPAQPTPEPVPPPVTVTPAVASVLPPAVAWARAGFFIRMAALALDTVLIGMIFGLLPRGVPFQHGPGVLLVLLAIYGAVMWKLKGTTIGGIVCGLKVVRVDQRELDWATAIVRALGCFLSLAVGGLGFIWVAFDDEKQSWHDKIAGTTVVRVPKGVSLV
ncbi:MAG: RDD family protein [Opitutaceae bacterium]|nr:RDD family protein [Opitutaceae bacterium]